MGIAAWRNHLPTTDMIFEVTPGVRLLGTLLLSVAAARAIQATHSCSVRVRSRAVACLGLLLASCFCRWYVVFNLLSVFATYALCRASRGYGRIAAALNFAFLMGVYAVWRVDGYDISWTTPQAVLCLRLMGFALDFESPSPPANVAAWNDLAIPEMPRLVDFLGFSFFPGAFLVGPQFPFPLFSKFLDKAFVANAAATRYALNRLGLGLLYVACSQAFGVYFDSSMFLTADFAQSALAWRLLMVWVVGKTALSKYLGIWLIAESACAMAGLSHNNGQWDALTNILPLKFETITSLSQVVSSFNINTNHWAKIYVFKRLRFLNNKNLSAIGTLLFLALWHGFHASYYITFSLEFLDFEAESALRLRMGRFLARKNRLVDFVCWLVTTTALHYSIVIFDLLEWPKILTAMNTVYWFGHLAALAVVLLNFLFPLKKIK